MASKAHVAPRLLPEAATKSYVVASAWETAAALSDLQLRVLDDLSEHVAQRPLPQHLVEDAAPAADGVAAQQHHSPKAVSSPATAAAAATGDAANGGDHGAPQQHGQHLDGDGGDGALEDVVLQNTHQFYKWIAELEAARSSETETKYQQYAASLHQHLGVCESILAKVDGTLELFEVLRGYHATVATKTRALHGNCEKMVRQKETLQEFADALRSKLAHFEELDSISADIARAKSQPDGNHFLPLLQRLDDCISYMTSTSPQYAESNQYAAKFRQLQGQAMHAVQQRVATVLRQAHDTVVAAAVQQQRAPPGGAAEAAAVANGGPPAAPLSAGAAAAALASLAQGTEAAVLYVRFRAVAEPGLKGLVEGLELRAARGEYRRLLAKCASMYCEVRQQLMSSVVQRRIADYAREGDLPSLTRNGCAYLLQVCQLEVQLVDHFFPSAAADPAAALQPLAEPLCLLLYDVVRPRLLKLQSMDELCELVDVLQLEVLNEQLVRRGDSAAPMRPVLERLLADVRSRLTYKAQAHIRDTVLNYRPTADDLDYPERLSRVAGPEASSSSSGKAPANAAESSGVVLATAAVAAATTAEHDDGGGEGWEELDQGPGGSSGNNAHASSSSSLDKTPADGGDPAAVATLAAAGTAAGGAAAAGSTSAGDSTAAQDPYYGWYPPVQTTLVCLSKLYRCLDDRVFSGLAQDAVASAASAIQAASRTIAKKSGLIDGYLFQIKQLLILREQLAPFDADFATVEKQLDFSHMRDHLRRIVAGQASLFSLSTDNALMQFVGRGSVRVREAQVDGKAQLELQLKDACERLIVAVTKAVVEPMLAFITVVTAVRLDPTHQATPLREQAFASVERLQEVVAKVREALNGDLPEATAKMRLYLASPSTLAVLFKPIKSNIAEAHAQIAQLLEGDYTEQERQAVGLTEPQELARMMDALC